MTLLLFHLNPAKVLALVVCGLTVPLLLFLVVDVVVYLAEGGGGGGAVDGICFFPGGGLEGGTCPVFFVGGLFAAVCVLTCEFLIVNDDVVVGLGCVFACEFPIVNDDVVVGLCCPFDSNVEREVVTVVFGGGGVVDVVTLPAFELLTNGEFPTILFPPPLLLLPPNDFVDFIFVCAGFVDDSIENDLVGFTFDDAVVELDEAVDDDDDDDGCDDEGDADFDDLDEKNEGFDSFGIEDEDDDDDEVLEVVAAVDDDDDDEVDALSPGGDGLVLSECFPCFLLLSFKKLFIFPNELEMAELIDDDADAAEDEPFTSITSAIVSDLWFLLHTPHVGTPSFPPTF